jgi:hypothetical protein
VTLLVVAASSPELVVEVISHVAAVASSPEPLMEAISQVGEVSSLELVEEKISPVLMVLVPVQVAN